MKQKLLGIVLIFSFSVGRLGALPGQGSIEERWWFMLELGKRKFREGELGDALLTFEDAIRQRNEYFTSLYQALVSALSLPEIRIYGDILPMAEKEIKKRNLIDAFKAIEETKRVAEPHLLNDSVNSLLSRLKYLAEYPEAQYWAGRVLAAEGEYDLAIKRYNRALDAENPFSSQEEGRNILYAMADLYHQQGAAHLEEESLTKILEQDEQYQSWQTPFIQASLAKNISGREGLDHVLQLYRYPASEYFLAHEMLSTLYRQAGRWERAWEHALYAFLISSTSILQEISLSNSSWTFETLEDAHNKIKNNYELQHYVNSQDWYPGMYWLAVSSWYSGKQIAAQWIWHFLASLPEAGEWAKRSQLQLQAPFNDY